MELGLVKFLGASGIYFTTLFSGWIPLRARAKQQHQCASLGESLASGVFLGAALFHMLPEAHEGFEQAIPTTHYPFASLFCVLGFMLLLLLDKLSFSWSHTKEAKDDKCILAYILTLAISIHAFIEGAALGVNTALATVSIIFIAVLAHKGSESFSLVTILNRSSLSLTRINVLFLSFALVTPLGIVLGNLAAQHFVSTSGVLVTAFCNALAAGTFLYIATMHNLKEYLLNGTRHAMNFACMVVGLAIMAVIAIWV